MHCRKKSAWPFPIPSETVDWCAQQAELTADMRVLEVGAGAGQLTAALRSTGVRVDALEPGARLREVLDRRFGNDPGVTVIEGLFEDLADGQFDGIWSANAFHWVDPAVGYPRARSLLRPGAALVLIWTYLLVRGQDAADILRDDVPGGELTFFCPHSPSAFLDDVEQSAADGRRQLVESGCFSSPVWRSEVTPFHVPAVNYGSLVLSFANAASTGTSQERRDLRGRIGTCLRDRGIDEIAFDHHAYAVVATACAPS